MLQTLRNIFNIPELKRRILFTLGIFFVYRLGAHVPVPMIDRVALAAAFEQQKGTLFGLYDMFAGGNFGKATIFALGIMPYISASIILQLLGTVIPTLQKLQQEGEEGRKKITQWTRYLTVGIAMMQSLGVAAYLASLEAGGRQVVPGGATIGFYLLTMLTMTTGTVFIMWLGERITERGIGNGISLLIFIGIVDRIPWAFLDEFQMVTKGIHGPIMAAFLLVMMFFAIVAVVYLTQGVRKIPVQYAKRMVGRKMMGGQSTHIPLRVNTAGVMPIIFAQTIMFVPSTLATFLPDDMELRNWLHAAFTYDNFIYMTVYAILIVFFTYFYTAVAFNPTDVANNLKKYGGLIPAVKPGKKTSDYLDNILSRITLPGAIALALVAIVPTIISKYAQTSYNFAAFFGGTGLLILVGVALDTLQQIESHLLMRHYDGLMKSGRIRGRANVRRM
ncbi:MAG: preprotein translocase subunit SecY [bacterium]|nr:preprotein translocase subunit SecY [bacterium]